MYTGLLQRCYASAYDLISRPAERAGLADQRHGLLSGATGVTIEIGAGTGLNLRHYQSDVTRLVLIEPDRHMNRQLSRRAANVWPNARIIRADADQLPFAAASFDTAVVSFMLCCVPDQRRTLAEIARVLVPGGKLLFLEHVRSSDPRVAAKQDKMPFPYPQLGCHPNRDTLSQIQASGLTVQSVRRGEVPRAPEIERPMIIGSAVRSPADRPAC